VVGDAASVISKKTVEMTDFRSPREGSTLKRTHGPKGHGVLEGGKRVRKRERSIRIERKKKEGRNHLIMAL